MSDTKQVNLCIDYGQLVDLAASHWFKERNPDRMPKRCTMCALDALSELIAQIPDRSSRAQNGRAS